MGTGTSRTAPAVVASVVAGAAASWVLYQLWKSAEEPSSGIETWRRFRPRLLAGDAARRMQLAAFEKRGIAEAAARRALSALKEACDPKAIPAAAGKRLFVARTGPDAVALCARLEAELRAGPAVLALDSEHNKSGTTSGLLCVLQASTVHSDVIFDLCKEDVRLALSGVDGPLAALLSDAESLKLLHGCSNDAVWLATNLDVAVLPPILDTQEAARCCSMPTTAFGALATELLAAGKEAASVLFRDMASGLAEAWSGALTAAALGSGSDRAEELARAAASACAHAGWDEAAVAAALSSRPGAAAGGCGCMTRDRLAMKRARGAKALIPRRTRMYDNIEMWDAPPNNALLAKVGRRKAVWYLSRDLGYFQLTTGERAVLAELGARGEAAAAAKASELGLSMTARGGAGAREEDVRRFVADAPPAGDNGLPPGVSAAEFASGEVFSSLGRAMMELDAASAARAAADPGKLRPVRLRLRQPARGKGMGGDAFHLEDKVNCCVVCGSAERLTRLYVVPKPIRVCMPPQCKSHNSHDVVLCCTSCNVIADSELSAHVRSWLSRLGVSSGRAATQELCRKTASRIASGALVVGGAAGGGMASWSDSPLPLAPVNDTVRAWQSVMDKTDLGASAPIKGLMEVLRCVVETGPVWGPHSVGPDGRPMDFCADPAGAPTAAGAAAVADSAVAATGPEGSGRGASTGGSGIPGGGAGRMRAAEDESAMLSNAEGEGEDAAVDEGGPAEDRDKDDEDKDGDDDEDDDEDDEDDEEEDDEEEADDDEDAKLPLARRIALAGARRVLPLLLAGARLAGSERRSPPADVLARARRRAALLVTVMAPPDCPVALDAQLPAAKKLRSLSRHNSTDGATMLVDAMAAGTVSPADLLAALDSDLTVVPCVEPPRIEAFLVASGWLGASATDGAAPESGSPLASTGLSERASLSLFVAERANGKAFAARAVRLLVAGPTAALGLERCSVWAEEEAALSPEQASGGVAVTALGAAAERRLNQFVRSFRQHFKDRMQPKALQRNWSVDYPAVLDKGGR
ncbi:hypothetical protein FNF29_05210 [Cafeteria roenbergensis]|uniref:3'-5' exonuclease domain-containing protein n=1 Tax=Cafeteria roenbergensis TaxID=33653 RepID=A0A5A8CCH1_CAFRO|nr:hypothetical protein FNF29_05210 [Cafeteria roenbergensis]|eukprot:KAA0150635.1 hypothetical protein FNF29_05210 [Cafeteria roenbergensis]